MAKDLSKPTSLCGRCTVCCYVLAVPDVPGGDKPANTPCRWLHHGNDYSGCRIYPDRPLACQKFECHYIKLARRQDLTTTSNIRPDNSGVMLVHLPDRRFFAAHVYDPLRRGAWKDPEMVATIDTLIHEGYKVIITWGTGNRLLLEQDGQGGIQESTLPEDIEEENNEPERS